MKTIKRKTRSTVTKALRVATDALNSDIIAERNHLLGIIAGLAEDIEMWHSYVRGKPLVNQAEMDRLKEARDMLNGVSPAPSFPTTLYVLIIDNDSGLTSSIHRTKAGATDALFAYVKDNWDVKTMGEMPKISAPQDQDVAIDIYFKDDSTQDVGERAQILPCKIED